MPSTAANLQSSPLYNDYQRQDGQDISETSSDREEILNEKARSQHNEQVAAGHGFKQQDFATGEQFDRNLEHRPTDLTSSDVPVRKLEKTDTSFGNTGAETHLFTESGEMILIPARTNDPKDPLNMPLKNKILGLGSLCCFGALAASAELILGAMLPVFALQYANIDPKILKPLTSTGGFPNDINPLKVLDDLPHAPPIWKTYLLASLPVLMMGISNLFLIPMAIAIGRRPVVLFCGVIAIGCCIWAGFSSSLDSHLAARCFQALGAGTVESLIPFVIQDMVHFHQRNIAISAIFATQGTIIIALGIAAPYCIINLSWRYLYYITAAGAGGFLIGVYLWMPETRYYRSKSEMRGIPRKDSETDMTPRTFKSDIRLQSGPVQWRKGVNALVDSLRTFFYPHIFFITMLNSAMIAATFAAGYTVSPALLTQPWSWPFLHLGFCLFPVLISAVCVVLITGSLADKVANSFAKKRGKRLPENQLINLVLPTICGVVGSVLFGIAGKHPEDYPWAVFLLGFGLLAFGFLGANTVGAVYVLECYPQLAGPALVNIASFRCILAFVLSFRVAEWIVDFGYFEAMIIYTSLIAAFGLLLPVVFIWGPSWRKRWPGPDRELDG